MGYQNSKLAFEACEPSRSILVHLMSQASRGHCGAEELAQPAKGRYCPGCTCMTHVAFPPAFVLGSTGLQAARGVKLRMDPGPWGGRRLAAHSYDMANRYLATTCDWAAMSLGHGRLVSFLGHRSLSTPTQNGL